MKWKPTYNRVIIKAEEPDKKTKGGLFVPEAFAKTKGIGRLISAARAEDPKLEEEMKSYVGELVIFSKDADSVELPKEDHKDPQHYTVSMYNVYNYLK